jgi:hypothetical protein
MPMAAVPSSSTNTGRIPAGLNATNEARFSHGRSSITSASQAYSPSEMRTRRQNGSTGK